MKRTASDFIEQAEFANGQQDSVSPKKESGATESASSFTSPESAAAPRVKKQRIDSNTVGVDYDDDDDADDDNFQTALVESEESEEIAFDELQLYAIESAVERRDNVFLTGKAGVGKSRCVAEIVRRAVAKQLRVAVTATTGIAAQGLAEHTEQANIVPSTVHRFAGLPINEYSLASTLKKIHKSKFVEHRWRSVDMWIIDEISMLSPVLFMLLDRVARSVRGIADRPFGGITMVFVGDFFQLPPVMIDQRELELAKGATHCFLTPNWTAAVDVRVVLQTVYRQSGDTRLIDILNQVRHGKLDQAAANALHNRTFSVLMDDLIRLDGRDPMTEPDYEVDVTALKQKLQAEQRSLPAHLMPLLSDVEPTKLVSKNALVDCSNRERLAALEGESVFYNAHATCEGKGIKSAAQASMLKDGMRKGSTAPERLELKVGAQVMLLTNLSDSLVNGSRGVVLGYREEPRGSRPAWVVDASGRRKKRKRGRCEADKTTECIVAGVAEDERPKWPLVLFDNGERRLMVPHVWSKRSKKPAWRATRTQVPLKLAWAISIHKSQGMSISNLSVDLHDTFASGQSYVALSRARSLDGLMLDSFDERMIVGPSQQPNPKVVAYYERMEADQAKRCAAAAAAARTTHH